jgi:GntR family transcriptional regulator, transcriptional repressor for pyruvate dehydrogenase complex
MVLPAKTQPKSRSAKAATKATKTTKKQKVPKHAVKAKGAGSKSAAKSLTSKSIVTASAAKTIKKSVAKPAQQTTKNVATRSVTSKGAAGAARWPRPDANESLVRVQKVGEVVAARIRKQIATGALPVGHQLPREEELTATFGIARTTLREALRVLESQGLLEIKRGRGGGGIVTMPRLDNLSQSFALALQMQQTTLGDLDEARMMIEPPLAARLATQHTDEDLEVLGAIVDQANGAAEADDRKLFGAAAAALHEAIIVRGGNNTLAVLGALLHDLLDRHLAAAAAASSQEQMRLAVRSYRKLLVLIESGDATGASAHWHRQLVFLHRARATVQLLDVFDE